MSEKLRAPLKNVLREVAPDEAAQGRMWDEIRRRNGSKRPFVPILAAVAAAACIAWLVLRPGPLRLADGSPLVVAAGSSTLDDGSQLRLDGKLDVRENGRERASFKLHGRAEVSLRPRDWVIQGDGFTLRTRGGRFIVASWGERAEVQVIEGEVVLEGRVNKRLAAGERWSVEPAILLPAAPAPSPTIAPAILLPVAPPKKPAPKVKKEDWRELARENKYREAYQVLAETGVAPQKDARVSLDELIGRADVARLSGHASEALPILQRILDEYPEDRRAALAAFTKGRIHADELHQPRDAARAFDRAIELGLPASLAEDAHARSVEAWLAAGDVAAARATAARYQSQFPTGKHLGRIQKWLESR
jgi:transmembrane sensor